MRIVSKIVLALSLATPLVAADAPQSAFQTTFNASFDAANAKITSLVGAFPDDKLEWRPTEGVLSTREVILHVAGANFMLGTMTGAKLPEGTDPKALARPGASKAELLAVLEKSIAFAHGSVAAVADGDLATEMDMFGTKTPRMRFLLMFSEHAHEHLGQLIAYARSNGVTPPWSK